MYANPECHANLLSFPGIWRAAGKSASAFRGAAQKRARGHGIDGGLGTGVALVRGWKDGRERAERVRLARRKPRRRDDSSPKLAAVSSIELESRNSAVLPRALMEFRRRTYFRRV